LHTDHLPPLLGDTACDGFPPLGPLLGDAPPSAQSPARAGASVSGDYWVFRNRNDCLVFDAGRTCTDELPAHGHCDLLGFESSLGGKRFIVDSGVFSYEDDKMRRYCRSTAAHNVLQIDGVEQCDVWGKFRMGYRGWPTRFESGQAERYCWAAATHNGYRRLGVPVVGRIVVCSWDVTWVVVDWATGDGTHQLENRLHLHPDVTAETMNGSAVGLRVGEVPVSVSPIGTSVISLERGWYCPRFGSRLASTVLVSRSACSLPSAMGWIITKHEREPRIPSVQIRDNWLSVTLDASPDTRPVLFPLT
jgi:uncharacterized heparinase superfamily protein